MSLHFWPTQTLIETCTAEYVRNKEGIGATKRGRSSQQSCSHEKFRGKVCSTVRKEGSKGTVKRGERLLCRSKGGEEVMCAIQGGGV